MSHPRKSPATTHPEVTVPALRRLYFARFGFAVVWAALVFVLVGQRLTAVGVTLAVLYPLYDVVANVIDLRTSHPTSSARGLWVNIAISLLAGVGIALAAPSGLPAVLRVWGAWAITAGLAQLVVGVIRRALAGQWPMMLSGAISVLAGTSFILQAGTPGASLSKVAGYATLGGLFFLASAVRMHIAARKGHGAHPADRSPSS